MKRVYLIVLTLTLLFGMSVLVDAAIPASERGALIALYNSTNGDSWKDNSGWKTPPLDADGFAMPGTENDWFGITVTDNSVREIYFYYNGLTGTIPPELGNLSGLWSLNMSSNQLTGAIPPQLGNLSQLVDLRLYVNQLSGAIPPELGQLSNLTMLELSMNQLSGTIPASIANLTRLTGFGATSNRLSGSIPAGLGQLTSLKTILLGANQLTGSIPPQLGNLVNIELLSLYNNQLSGSIPPELGNMARLKKLQLDGNQLSGDLPPELGNLSNLEELRLHWNQLTGVIPSEFGNMRRLVYLRMEVNQLSGNIPVSLTTIGSLKWMFLFHNQLSGNLPKELGNVSNLEALSLSSNNFTGSIPLELGKLSKLKSLSLERNQFSGPIPPELGNLSDLEILNLSVNHLTGGIPSELGNLSLLRVLVLAANGLKGEVPASITNLVNLTPNSAFTALHWNGLYTSDPAVKAFLDGSFGNWEEYQNVAPDGLNASAVSDMSITVSWTPIQFLGSNGRYHIYYSTSSGGPWTEAGTTEHKFYSSYNVTGLNPATTYYFVVSTESDAHPQNQNTLVSEYSEEVSATTLLPSGAFLLNVQSSPYSGTGITVSPGDFYGSGSGSTNFTRLYNDGTVVTLTAPATYSNNNFLKWTVDGIDNPNSTIQVTMNANHNVTAVYEQVSPPETYTLTVQSSPDSGASIAVSPNDNDGNGTGSTTFTRTYNEGTQVTLTAPAEYNGNYFSKWLIDGAVNTARTVMVTMDASHSTTAVYEEDDSPPPTEEEYTLTVESTTGSGAAITVSPSDNNGESDGSTKFTRTYDSGTVVTLTAPAEHKNQKFAYWKIDNVIRSNSQTVEFTITGDHKAKAFYTTASRPGLVLSRGKINFGYEKGDALPPTQTLRVTINGTPVDWSAAVDVSWLVLSKTSGTGTAEITLSINPDGLAEGRYDGIITVTAPDADNSPQTAKVTLTVYGANGTTEPIGDFSTPLDGSTVSSSVPVTGWVVDDLGIENVKIYREGKNAKDLIYIGDAIFVEGARPDVEELFPDYPGNYQAGWGYMLLTNFFPEGGNGTFVLHAIATDVEGNSVTLGTKTITCDNANAVKPFGAIDTPTQGGIASGSGFINWGWVLTPQPNSIPIDGSTIDVYVDGVKLGHPNYNIYREDIATFFPGYANSSGAIGYYILDTTLYDDGIHTIQWVAKDSAGNTDGIGSRFFTIDNSDIARSHANVPSSVASVPFPVVGVQFIEPAKGDRPEISIDTRELEPLEIHLEGRIVGHSKLPVGSTLDSETGKFNWSPGAVFVGEYRFVFVEELPDGRVQRKTVNVTIAPRFK